MPSHENIGEFVSKKVPDALENTPYLTISTDNSVTSYRTEAGAVLLYTASMGLAAPRKRAKIAHDPRNLQWSSTASQSSIGHRLMTSQGWSEGQSLGVRTPSSRSGTSTPLSSTDDAARLAAAKVGVLFKDDTLGLGAKLKSKDVEGQKTGLHAFQGLLGRLNSKNVEEERDNERRVESRRLEGYARGRWGGMCFVPGGLLVQGEAFKNKREMREKLEQQATEEGTADVEDGAGKESSVASRDEKAERKRRKEDRRARREERRARKAEKADKKLRRKDSNQVESMRTTKSKSVSAPDEATSSSDEATLSTQPTLQLLMKAQHPATVTETIRKELPRNGRHILRGRNIEAKRKAFSDMKGLDAIFMK